MENNKKFRKQSQDDKHFLNLAGEYGVCSELAKQKIHGSITYGQHKAADIIVVNPENKKALILEVKTTRNNRILTGFFQKYITPDTPHPDFWIVVYIDRNNSSRYFVLSHKEMAIVQMQRNNDMIKWEYIKGVDNIQLETIEKFENKWDKILIELKIKN